MAVSSLRPPRGGDEIGVSATGRFLEDEQVLKRFPFRPGQDLLIGAIVNDRTAQYVGVPIDDRHGFTVAGSRAGKGASFIIPNLRLYPGSILANDPKGELARETAQYRLALGQDVAILDPFGETDFPCDSFNPLDIINPESDEAMDEAALIADALIIQESDKNKHFTESARNFIQGIVLYVATSSQAHERTCGHVRSLLSLPVFDMAEPGGLFDRMRALGGFAKEAADAFASKHEEEQSSVLSTAQEQTTFLSSPAIRRALGPSSFSMDDLKTSKRGLTVYIVLPARRLATHSRFLRLMINVGLSRLEAVPNFPTAGRTANGAPVLFMLDEFSALGHMTVLERAAGLMAGFGCKMHIILQDLTQIKRLYKESWETFLGNSGIMNFFGNVDQTTCDYVSKLSGEVETVQLNIRETDETEREVKRLEGWSQNMVIKPLLDPAEVRRYFARERNTQLVIIPGNFPIAVKRVAYFDKAHAKLFRT
ncbi:MAG: type IV secretory system conjugative DNA transfer family protein [Pseudomonadota bacterium]